MDQRMSSLAFGNLAYLVLLGGVLVFWLFVQNRESLGKKAQAAAAWGLIFLGTIAAIGLWDDIRQTVTPQQAVFADQGRVALPARAGRALLRHARAQRRAGRPLSSIPARAASC